MNTVRKNRLTTALLAALLLPAAAVAQQTDAANEKSEKQVAADERSKTEVQQLTGITVTARKREESLQTVPVAVTAYSAASPRQPRRAGPWRSRCLRAQPHRVCGARIQQHGHCLHPWRRPGRSAVGRGSGCRHLSG
nr:hypothetical protein [Dokdonella sp.]